MKVSDFDYDLPEDRIARFPAEKRDASRLLVLRRAAGAVEHRRFSDLPRYLRSGDALVLNETKVCQARISGRRPSGGRADFLLVGPHPAGGWEALARPARRLRPGESVALARGRLEILERLANGRRRVELRDEDGAPLDPEAVGRPALPPYIRREPDESDRERYQTVYARVKGAVAAPTAGLHFTPELLDEIARAGVALVRLVLHVGVGTFKPVRVEDPSEHRMEAEYYDYPASAARELARVRAAGGRVVCVGTTCVRVLETVGLSSEPQAGWTDLFIKPPHVFRTLDALVTNFHLPRSTLLMLASAFAGTGVILRAYREARDAGYRFYSYGDAMLIL